MEPMHFTLLYDGACPFCKREMLWLHARDPHGRIRFVDIAAPGFTPSEWGLTHARVQARLHGFLENGTMVEGWEASMVSLQCIGYRFLPWLLRLPVLRHICNVGYWLFARYRIPLGKLFGRTDCDVACLPRPTGSMK